MSPIRSGIFHIKNDEYFPYKPPGSTVDSLNVVHYKPTPNRLQQMKRHEIVQQTDDYSLNNVWCVDITTDDKYEEHRWKFLEVLEEFSNMWDGHLGV